MSLSKRNQTKKQKGKSKPSRFYIVSGIFAVLVVAVIIIRVFSGPDAKSTVAASPVESDIKITKSQITDKATFIPYQSGSTKMEIVAVKAPDGTIKTALNTCRVCYDSGRGYYMQEGDELVCQNCGNRFDISRVGNEKNGCNPVPVLDENKTDDGQTITIPASFLKQNANYFTDWKR